MHQHQVYDTDNHFVIDPITKEIINRSEKMKLMQGDHNSERFTFEIPRYIDGHDMTLCDKIEVHYINIDSKTKESNKDVYLVDDMQLSPNGEDVVVFSWLISSNATKLAGTLNFRITFKCISEPAIIDYQMSTEIFKGITVSDGISNGEAVIEEYSDVLEQWKQELNLAGEYAQQIQQNASEISELQTGLSESRDYVNKIINYEINWNDGGYISKDDGNVYDETGSSYSDYVTVIPGTKLIITNTMTENNEWNAFYDANKTFLSPFSNATGEVIVPDGAVKMRLSKYSTATITIASNIKSYIDDSIENVEAKAKSTDDAVAELKGDLFNYEESLGWVKNNPQLPTSNYKWYNAYFTDTGLYTVSDKYIQMPEWETNYIVDKDIKITVNSGYVFNVFFFSHKNAFNPDNFVGKLKESFDSNEAVIEYNKYKNLYYSIVIGKEDGTVITTDECINVNAYCKCKLDLPYVTPEMFGAKGDGVTNDGKALRLALTSGKKLIIPQKTYAFDYLKLPNGCEIEGMGENSVLLNSFETTNPASIFLPSVENIRVHLKNFKLIGSFNTIDGIRIDNTNGPSNSDDHWHLIDGLHVEGFKNGITMIKTRECRTVNCTIRNCKIGFYYYNCADGSITLCTASQNSEEGFRITQGSNYRIINNKAFMNKNGFYINEYTEWGNIIVSCCEEQDNSQYGYYLDTSKDITISDCLGGGTPNSIVVNGITGLNVSGHFMIRGQGHKILKTIGALKNAKIDVFTNNLVDESVLYEFSETPINTKLVIDIAEQVIN